MQTKSRNNKIGWKLGKQCNRIEETNGNWAANLKSETISNWESENVEPITVRSGRKQIIKKLKHLNWQDETFKYQNKNIPGITR